jgi:hypothetical protein
MPRSHKKLEAAQRNILKQLFASLPIALCFMLVAISSAVQLCDATKV